MRDVLRLVHPKPRDDKESEMFKKIVKGELESPETWEVIISKEGSKKETWEKAVKVMPIMALLRNLRNLLENKVSEEAIQYTIAQLRDEKTILNSKQFPFRFLSAYRAIQNTEGGSRVLSALDYAMSISIRNLPILDGATAVFGDNSGSMTGKVSGKSEIQLMDVGSMLGGIASIISPDNITGVFADDFKIVNFSVRESALARAEKMKQTNVGGSTMAYKAFKYLVDNGIKVHRIFLFSDMQCYNEDRNIEGESVYGYWEKYKQRVNPGAYLYSFDLAGYGTSQVPEDDPRVLLVAGWTENILRYIPYFERDRKTVLQEIRQIEPDSFKKIEQST